MKFLNRRAFIESAGLFLGSSFLTDNAAAKSLLNSALARTPAAKRNIVFILIDDLRYDCLGFMEHPFLKTPNIDKLVKNGANCCNSFVTTSLCSPSRASILTGQYMHNHRVVDNNDMMSADAVTFPQLLRRNGYRTAFIGKWHMGSSSDEPRSGFDHWVSFHGQGQYLPEGQTLNVNGSRVPRKKYMTEELTDEAIKWLENRDDKKPFFLYLSHKAIHGPYVPDERHEGIYTEEEFPEPETMANTEDNYKNKPMWVKNQRNSWHGVDYPYHTREPISKQYRRYCEMILSVDQSVGRIMQSLEENGFDKNTLVVFMGDNGHYWGEHGLIDKRSAYEESMRVPLFAYCPELIKPGTVIEEVVANIDIAPTLLSAAGIRGHDGMDGRSFLPLLKGEKISNWRDFLLYEYYWEYNFPHTPTTFALRTDRYKLIQYHGVWDIDEFYDLKADPNEKNNLINNPDYQKLIKTMRAQLHEILERANANVIPFGEKKGHGANLRHREGADSAEFPAFMFR
jgi:N-acetylglucosamine-6-sulfatase